MNFTIIYKSNGNLRNIKTEATTKTSCIKEAKANGIKGILTALTDKEIEQIKSIRHNEFDNDYNEYVKEVL